MRVATAGEVWEWCRHSEDWEPVLLLERVGASKRPPSDTAECYDWKALNLISGEIEEVCNVPAFGWEKLE